VTAKSIVKNYDEIIRQAETPEDRRAREIALEVIAAAIVEVDPAKCIERSLRIRDGKLFVEGYEIDLTKFRNIYVVGGGKASGRMAEALEKILGDKITYGFVNILKGTKNQFKTSKIELNEAAHPIPDENGRRGAEKIVEIVKKATEKDLIICLISGGASALMPLPSEKIALNDKIRMTELLLKCGATIDEVNIVRKHISDIKGGKLARYAYPATIVSLILSDVVGDPIDTIASGPTAPDRSTFKDAISVLKKYSLWKKTPESIRRHLLRGLEGEIEENPKPGDALFSRVFNFVIGNNMTAVKAAKDKAENMELKSVILSTMIEGEARHVGIILASIAKEVRRTGNPIKAPAVILGGGETTVTVKGSGIGGRNQEVALSAALKIKDMKGVVIASVGTDGLDGPTDAAGAIVDGTTAIKALGRGIDPIEFLENNDSYRFFKKVGGHIITGPTGTNVNDIFVITIV